MNKKGKNVHHELCFFNEYRVCNMFNSKKIKLKNFAYLFGHPRALETVKEQRMDESDPGPSASTSRRVLKSHHPLRLSGDLTHTSS